MKLRRSSTAAAGQRWWPGPSIALTLLTCTLLPLASLEAQAPRERMRGPMATDRPTEGPAGQRQGMNAIERHFVPPEIVMRLREELALTENQKNTIIAELQSAQSDLVPLRFEAQEAEAALSKMVQESSLDEERVLQQARRVMDLEAEVRARHLALLVRIKNLLTDEQQRRIQQIRQRQRAARGLLR